MSPLVAPAAAEQNDLAFARREVGGLRRGEHRRRARPSALRQPEHGPILHAGGRMPDGLLLVNVWPSRDGSEAAAADARRLAALEQEAITPQQLSKELYVLERCYLPARGRDARLSCR
jgi:hypothetical protein